MDVAAAEASAARRFPLASARTRSSGLPDSRSFAAAAAAAAEEEDECEEEEEEDAEEDALDERGRVLPGAGGGGYEEARE